MLIKLLNKPAVFTFHVLVFISFLLGPVFASDYDFSEDGEWDWGDDSLSQVVMEPTIEQNNNPYGVDSGIIPEEEDINVTPLELPFPANSTADERAAIGLEVDNKLMGTPLSGVEYVNFAELGYAGVAPILDDMTLQEKMESLEPEEKTRVGGLVVEEKLGMDKDRERSSFVIPNSDREINLYFLNSYREQPNAGSGMSYNAYNTEIIDVKKVKEEVEILRDNIGFLKEGFAKQGLYFNGLGTDKMTDQQLYVSRLKGVDMHEKGHLFTEDLLGQWFENSIPEATKEVMEGYYDPEYLPGAKKDFFNATAEIAGHLAEFQGTDTPQYNLQSMNSLAQYNTSKLMEGLQIQNPEHFYAQRTIALNVLDEAGFYDYIREKALKRLNDAYDWMPPQEAIDKKKAEIKERYIRGDFLNPEFLMEQNDFIQQIPGERIKEITKKHFQNLFGAENLPSTDLMKFPDSVLNREPD